MANRRFRSRRRLDVSSLLLLLVGLLFGGYSYWLITVGQFTPLIAVPSIFAVAVGASHLTKQEAPRP